jgi:hypothetical protein
MWPALERPGARSNDQTLSTASAGRRERAHLPEEDLQAGFVLLRTDVGAPVWMRFSAPARQLLAAALPAEVVAYLGAHVDEVDEHDWRLVVRNGYHAPGEVTTAAGAVLLGDPARLVPQVAAGERGVAAAVAARVRR